MGSENRADQLWDFLSNWFMEGGKTGPTRLGISYRVGSWRGGAGTYWFAWDECARITNNRAEGNVSLMKDSQILSAFQDLPGQRPCRGAAAVLVFDACHVGVVLRAVLFGKP